MIKMCEEILLNSDPSYADLFHSDFLIRMKTIKYPCIIHAIGDKHSSLAERVKHIEELLAKKNSNPSYRILYDEKYQALDEELLRQGYERVDEGTVKYMDIRKIQKELFSFASFIQDGVFVETSLQPFWVNQYRSIWGMNPEYANTFLDNLQHTQEDFWYFTMMKQNKVMGLGYASVDRGIFAVQDVVIDARYRGLSYGRRLVMSMLSYAFKNDIEHVIASVDAENEAANRLFRRIGFEDAYHHWQRYKIVVDK